MQRMQIALWGPDHQELNVTVTRRAGERVAVGITRGRFMKSYSYVDANEDVAAAVEGRRATLLVCADGHNGSTASRRAVEEVLAALGDDPPVSLDDRGWTDLFERANAAVLAATGPGSPHPASRTVLVVALVSAGRVSWGALGDGALLVGSPGRARQLNREAMRFVGYPMSRRALEDLLQRGSSEVGPGEWVVAVSDGLSEFIRPQRPARVLPPVLAASEGDPERLARDLIALACDHGAGDNVAVAVVAPG